MNVNVIEAQHVIEGSVVRIPTGDRRAAGPKVLIDNPDVGVVGIERFLLQEAEGRRVRITVEVFR